MKKALIDKYSAEELKTIVENSYSYREVLIKLGYSCTTGSNNNTLKERIKRYNISIEHFSNYFYSPRQNIPLEEVFCENSSCNQKYLRRKVMENNLFSYKCAKCGNEGMWMGEKLTLNLDHINGNNHDNRINNLRWLCPNCDRQQPTFGAKNFKHLEKDEILIPYKNQIKEKPRLNSVQIPERSVVKQKLFEYKNYTQCANFFGISSTQLRRWCVKYNLPTTISIIKHTTENGWETENWNDGYIPPQLPKPQNKPCAMLDKNTEEVLRIFSSRSEAAKFLNINKNCASHINTACNGIRQTAYGYKWRNI